MSSPDGRPVFFNVEIPWHSNDEETEDGVKYKTTQLSDWKEAKEAAKREYKVRYPDGETPLVNL